MDSIIMTLRNRLARRRFNWEASAKIPTDRLAILQEDMIRYYSEAGTRDGYQDMLDDLSASQPQVMASLQSLILAANPQRVVEIGCGSGWMLDRLMTGGLPEESYTGVELSEKQIGFNRSRRPNAEWIVAKGYEIPLESAAFDVAFSYFVIEHCVYPRKHLDQMKRLVRPGGKIVIVCPDFSSGGIFPSQYLGVAEGNSGELLRKGKILEAIVGLYDSRIRIKNALRKSHVELGPFVINMTPRCLSTPDVYRPDVDAVYLSCRQDLAVWAAENGCEFGLPEGQDGSFKSIVLAEMTLPN